MDLFLLGLNIVFLICLGLFIKNWLPSYMEEKGKNLATKEDIAEITRKTEEVGKEFKEKFEEFSSDLHFKQDYLYRQFSELYSKLYSIIIQSEYARRFLLLHDGKEVSFDDAPFLEVTPTRRVRQQVKFLEGEPAIYSQTEEKIENDLSEFSKKNLVDYIIDHSELASQELLKLAVAYRFAHFHYSGNHEAPKSSASDTGNEEEFRLIREVVCCVVSEYNLFRKLLKMNYDTVELETGIPHL